jgi:PAS domain S-box-containing protein
MSHPSITPEMTPDQLQLAFDAARVTIWNWDILADQVHVHPLSAPPPGAPEASNTHSRQEWFAAIHPEDRPSVEAAVQKSLESGCNFGSAFRVRDPRGQWRWIGVRAGLRRDAAGQPVEMSGVTVDITEQRNAELEIERREEAVSALINALDGIVWEADARTFQFLFVSRQAARILGFSVEDWLQPGFWVSRLHPDDAQWCIGFRENAAAHGQDHNFEYRMLARDGRVVWFHDFVAVQDALDGSARLRGVMVDITARKEAEQARGESEALFELLFDQSPAGLVIFDADAGKVRVNAAYCRFLGRSEQDVFSTSFVEKLHPDDRGQADWLIRELDQGRPVDVELRFLRGDGEIVWGRMIARRTSTEGRLLKGLSIVEDITAQKRAEAVLKESHENFRTVANATPAILWMSSADGELTFLNHAASEFFGSQVGKPDFDRFSHVHPDEEARSRQLYKAAVRDHTSVVNESRLRRFDGEYRWLLNRYVPRFSDAGEFLGHVGVATDITSRKLAEQQLEAAHSRLAAELGERARLQQELSSLSERMINAQEDERRRVARELHDSLGNQIAALTLGISALGRETGVKDTRLLAKMLSDMAQNIREISHQLHPVMLDYAGLAPALRELCSEFGELTQIRVAVVESEELGEIPPQVALCAYRVTQEALQNIAKHSGAKVAVVSLARENGALLLTICDRGAGFDPEAVRRHRGLGLVSIRERVRLLHGSLQIDSTPGQGTTLTVNVPY